MELLRNIWHSLDDEYQIHQNSVLQVLQGKAQAAISLIDSIIGKADGEARRVKYAVWVKRSWTSILVDLKEWSEVFNVSWYLIIRLSSREIDQELGRARATVHVEDLREAINHPIGTRESETATVFLPVGFFDDENDEIKTALLQSTAEIWSISTLSDVCNLSKILQKVRSLEFGILPCKGVLKSAPWKPLRLLRASEPQRPRKPALSPPLLPALRSSLRKILSHKTASKSSVMFVHSAGFVHKNIGPETIFVLRDEGTQLPLAFLTGFERFCLAEGKKQHQERQFVGG